MKRVLLVFLTAIFFLLSGCTMREFRLVQRKTEDGCVYYVADWKWKKDEPVVILCHGLGGSHVDMESAAEYFYRKGYLVVTFDLYGSEGVRYGSDILIDEMVEKSAEKIESILDGLRQAKNCDPSRYILHGYSLGGMTAFYQAAFGETKPSMIISMASVPDFEEILKSSLEKKRLKYDAEKWRLVYTTGQENRRMLQWAAQKNPANRIQQLAQIPIVMINGTEDESMPIQSAEEFKKQVERAGGRIWLYENQGGTHQDLGDYHTEEVFEIVQEIVPAD